MKDELLWCVFTDDGKWHSVLANSQPGQPTPENEVMIQRLCDQQVAAAKVVTRSTQSNFEICTQSCKRCIQIRKFIRGENR